MRRFALAFVAIPAASHAGRCTSSTQLESLTVFFYRAVADGAIAPWHRASASGCLYGGDQRGRPVYQFIERLSGDSAAREGCRFGLPRTATAHCRHAASNPRIAGHRRVFFLVGQLCISASAGRALDCPFQCKSGSADRGCFSRYPLCRRDCHCTVCRPHQLPARAMAIEVRSALSPGSMGQRKGRAAEGIVEPRFSGGKDCPKRSPHRSGKAWRDTQRRSRFRPCIHLRWITNTRLEALLARDDRPPQSDTSGRSLLAGKADRIAVALARQRLLPHRVRHH